MAVYLPQERVAIEIVDNPMSLPADLDAFPGYSVIPVTCAEVRDGRALDRIAQRIALMTGVDLEAGTQSTRMTREHLARLLTSGLELGGWSRPQHAAAR